MTKTRNYKQMKTSVNGKKLGRNFYSKELLVVANQIIGKIFVKKNGRKILSGRIVEVEAYDGTIDRAAHTYIGQTKRNKIMFNEGGYLYVYLSYGVNYCCNIVTGKEGNGTAVLIRALEPVDGIDDMIKNRFGGKLPDDKEIFNLTNGPGKVCKTFGINLKHSGIDLTGDKSYVIDLPLRKNEEVGVSRRIGISKSVELPWRFFIKDNPYISRK